MNFKLRLFVCPRQKSFKSCSSMPLFLPRVETRGIIEAIDSEPVTETKSLLNSQRKSI